MDLHDFNNKINELITQDNSQGYIIEKIEKQRKIFTHILNSLDEEFTKISISRQTLVNNVRYLYKRLIDSINFYLEGQYFDSLNIIYQDFFDRTNSKIKPLPSKKVTIKKEQPLFRVRRNDTYNLYAKESMFHIAFELRGIVTNQRYSMSGYPCLYLGSSIYNCWEETNRPNIDTCNIVALHSDEELNMIDFVIPEHKNPLSEEDIYQLVLPLACSLKTKNSNDNFKPEYIIPQNILSTIVSENKKNNDMTRYDGIMYTSTKYGSKQALFSEKNIYTNYVIPTKNNNKEGLCTTLWYMFKMTEPTSLTKIKLTKDEYNIYLPYDEDASLTEYNKSLFGQTEQDIINKSKLKTD